MPTLLAFIPHPDDEAYSFAGTIALAASAGWDCYLECASFGERGKRHDGGPTAPGKVADAREAELRASCRLLGAHPPRFWGLPDGELQHGRGEQRRVTRLIVGRRPDLVLSLGPDGVYGHPDHIALYRWVTEAWASLPLPRPPLLYAAFPAGLFVPQYEKCIGMMGDPPRPPRSAIGAAPWHYQVPIGFVRETKLASIQAHRSQLPGDDPEALFPPGIIAALLETERFSDASGVAGNTVAALLGRLGKEHS
ncbi:MAG: GlcNAc-PI de-N-acetylase [Dehalococcoidia bacterium]|nr:PIG-L family deacetylase [Tepidiformaceae bacterium]